MCLIGRISKGNLRSLETNSYSYKLRNEILPIKLHFILFGWNTMREINFFPGRNEVWIRNVTPHFLVLWFIFFKEIWKELFLKKINIYTVLIFIKVIGSKTSFQNHQPSKLHFVSGADEKRKFCRPVQKIEMREQLKPPGRFGVEIVEIVEL